MKNGLKYLVRALIAFSPTILLLLAASTGLVPKAGLEFDALGTVVSLVQGVVLLPFVVWMWVDFRRRPEKYSAPGWFIRVLDVIPLGFIVLVLAYYYMHGHQ